jgi:hypothetical protein
MNMITLCRLYLGRRVTTAYDIDLVCLGVSNAPFACRQPLGKRRICSQQPSLADRIVGYDRGQVP